MREIKIGDNVFSKNDYEFNCTVVDIDGSDITLEYSDNYTETVIVDKNILQQSEDGWETRNWTISLEQI